MAVVLSGARKGSFGDLSNEEPEKMMKPMRSTKPVILRISTITGPNKLFALEACKLV